MVECTTETDFLVIIDEIPIPTGYICCAITFDDRNLENVSTARVELLRMYNVILYRDSIVNRKAYFLIIVDPNIGSIKRRRLTNNYITEKLKSPGLFVLRLYLYQVGKYTHYTSIVSRLGFAFSVYF